MKRHDGRRATAQRGHSWFQPFLPPGPGLFDDPTYAQPRSLACPRFIGREKGGNHRIADQLRVG